MLAWPDTLDPVDPAVPAREHPLNQGLSAWWLVLPPTDGGSRLYDLRGLSPAALTNFDAASGWRSSFRPGGWGRLLFDGTDDYAAADSAALAGGMWDYGAATGFTVAGWFRTSVSSVGQVFSATSSSSTTPFATLAVASGKVRFQYRTDNNSELGAGTYDGAVTVNDNAWHHAAVVRSGSTFNIYVDGAIDKTGTSGLSFNTLTADRQTLGALRRAATTGDRFNGSIDDVRVYARPLSSAEVWGVYDLSRRGYPGVLRRHRPLAVFAGRGGW